jgi:hypothetical protein
MDAQFWSTVLPWATVAFSVLALASTGAGIIARDRVAAAKSAELQKLQPRKITEQQRATLIENLKANPSKVGMVTPLMDGEALDYAEALIEVFKAAGWDVVPTNSQSLNSFAGYVILGSADTGRMGTTLDRVAVALRAIGIDVRAEPIRSGSLGGQFLPDTGYIIIGRK